MRVDHLDRSFELRWESCHAQYDCHGSLQSAIHTKTRLRGKRCPRPVLKYAKTWNWLVKQGLQEIDLLNRGILKRKY